MAQRDELEARIAEDPTDVEMWKVYADLLQKLGDPRGELIALQMAADTERAANPKKIGKAQLAERKHLTTHAAALVGPLGAMGDQLTWRFGFVTAVRLDAKSGDPAQRLETVLAHASGRFVSEIAIRFGTPTERVDEVFAAIARHAPRALKELEIYAIGEIGPKAWWPQLERLQRVSFTAADLRLGGLELPAARRATFGAVCLPPASMRAIATAPWPVLERLEVRVGSRPPFAPFEDIVPLLRRTDLPALRVLKVRHAPFAGALLRELAMRPLGAQLEVIDLSHGQLTPQDVRFVAERKHVFAQLRELWLPVAATTGEAGKLLAGIAKHLVPDSKAPLDTFEREFAAWARSSGERFEGIRE